MTRNLLAAILGMLTPIAATAGEEPFLETRAIFPAEGLHNHASCLVECADGSLLVAWYRGSGERSADDVQIYGARRPTGADDWSERFLMDDTPGYPDCNPALFAAPDETLWLFYPTILDHRWEGALLKYRVADRSTGEGPPEWARGGVMHVTPTAFGAAFHRAMAALTEAQLELKPTLIEEMTGRADDELYQRLGWMPRVHPTVLPSGRWLLPLYTDTFSASIVAISDDRGASWHFSAPMIGFGNIQPSLVRRDDGTIVAFMRNNGPGETVCLSTSGDDGETWSPVVRSEIPNPGAGIEAIRLRSGRWALVLNDRTDGRYTLAVWLSEDEGRTWPHSRRLAEDPERRQSFHYPSIIQATDGDLHVSYTHGGLPEGSTIAHARFNEAWILADDPETPAP